MKSEVSTCLYSEQTENSNIPPGGTFHYKDNNGNLYVFADGPTNNPHLVRQNNEGFHVSMELADLRSTKNDNRSKLEMS